jgi:hypothetical protein
MQALQKPPDLDETGNPVDTKPPDLDENHQPETSDSLISRLWKTISSPIPAVKKWATDTGNDLTNSATEPGFTSTLKGFGAGALSGIADLATPLNIGTAGLGGLEFGAAKAGLPAIARAASMGSKVMGLPAAIHGAGEVVDPNASMMDRVTGVGDIAAGALPFLHVPKTGKLGNIAESAISPDIDAELAKLETHTPLSPEAQAHTGTKPPDIEPTIDEMIGQLGNASDLEVLPDSHLNGSGESAASLEAINRTNAMKANGEQFVVYDKAGNRRPLIGVDGVDYTVGKGETYGIEKNGQFQVLDDNGGLYPDKLKGKIAAIETNVNKKGSASPETTTLLDDLRGKLVSQPLNEPGAVYIKKPDPETIKKVMQKGYVFDSLRDDGAFKMVKSNKPVDLPVLETEVGQNRPTPANAARMMGGPAGGVTPSTTPTVKQPSKLTEAFNFPRAVMASMDFSAPLRQGLTLIHKKAFWTSLDDMFKAWGSEKAYQAIQHDILERPLFKPRFSGDGKVIKSFAEEAGLSLTDLKSLGSREENLMSSWAEKVPGVRRSNRAYTAFLNKLRADTFEDLVKTSSVFGGADTKANLPLARELANFVNVASGRGSLGKLEKSATTLNTVLFSPRLISSRLTMLNPRYYIMADPRVRKEALKSLFALAAAGNTLTQLGKMAGGSVESDPASSDFGKLKIGNTRLDPFGGFQQYIVAATRLLTGRDVSSTSGKEYDLNNPTGPFDPTRLGVIGNFGRSKLHPVLGFAYSLLNGQKEMTGQKMNFSTPNPMDNAIGQRFIPILFQDLYQLAQDDPSLLPIMGTLSTFGMGVQTYGGQQ